MSLAAGNYGRLATMMVVLYAIQGAWWPFLAVHLTDLGLTGPQRGWIFATLSMASIAMPLGAGHLVDRLMATQKYLALACALASGFLVVMGLGLITRPLPLFLVFLVFWLILAPCYGLSNSLALRNLPRPTEQFASVRLWGTVGWMAVGYLVSIVMALTGSTRSGGGASESFWIGAICAGFLAVFALRLPNTPPLAKNDKSAQGIRSALELTRDPAVAVFLIAAFCLNLTTPFVFQVMPTYLESAGLPRSWVGIALTLGQWPEIIGLAMMPRLISRVGYKGTLLLGLLAWFLRYASLIFNPPLWIAVGGIPLHGLGIAFATVGGQMFIDSRSHPERRAGAQSLHMVVTSGLGSFFGCLLAGSSIGSFATAEAGGYSLVFLVPCLINGLLIPYIYLGFHPNSHAPGWEPHLVNPARPTARHVTRGMVMCLGHVATESADG